MEGGEGVVATSHVWCRVSAVPCNVKQREAKRAVAMNAAPHLALPIRGLGVLCWVGQCDAVLCASPWR